MPCNPIKIRARSNTLHSISIHKVHTGARRLMTLVVHALSVPAAARNTTQENQPSPAAPRLAAFFFADRIPTPWILQSLDGTRYRRPFLAARHGREFPIDAISLDCPDRCQSGPRILHHSGRHLNLRGRDLCSWPMWPSGASLVRKKKRADAAWHSIRPFLTDACLRDYCFLVFKARRCHSAQCDLLTLPCPADHGRVGGNQLAGLECGAAAVP